MSRVRAEAIVGEHTVAGRNVQVQCTSWHGTIGLSYDLIDADTGDLLTTEESFGAYPSTEEIAAVLSHLPASEERDADAYCRYCSRAVGQGGQRIGAAEPGANPWCCEDCWDERLR